MEFLFQVGAYLCARARVWIHTYTAAVHRERVQQPGERRTSSLLHERTAAHTRSIVRGARPPRLLRCSVSRAIYRPAESVSLLENCLPRGILIVENAFSTLCFCVCLSFFNFSFSFSFLCVNESLMLPGLLHAIYINASTSLHARRRCDVVYIYE